jgi:anti-sigma B factor antagonist
MTNPQGLRLEIEVGDRTVVRLAGELDTAGTHSTRRLLTAYVRAGTTIVVDLSAVTYVGSSGLAALVDLHELARQQGSRLVVVTGPGNGPAHRALEIAGLTGTLHICPVLADG